MRRRRHRITTATPTKTSKLFPYFMLFMLVGIFISQIPSYIQHLREDTYEKIYKEKKTVSLEENIQKELEGAKATYGIAIKHLKNSQTYYYNEHRSFDSASLYKVWVMAIVYKQIQDGKIKETETLSGDVEAINKEFGIASESAELKEGEVKYTVKEALFRMITFSDNYSALLLTKRIGRNAITPFLREHGFSESKGGTTKNLPTTTAYDMSMFFQKLHLGAFANQHYTNEMIELLQKQQLNKVMPKLLPNGTLIAHKTGNLDKVSHDAGIVYSPTGEYIIALLSESDIPQAAEERMSKVSKKVYDYFIIEGNILQEVEKETNKTMENYKIIAIGSTITITIFAIWLVVKLRKQKVNNLQHRITALEKHDTIDP